MNLYPILKYVHILSAITAVGANITYGLWLTRAARDPKHLPFTLRTIKILDDWIANPAYVLLFPTGFGMAYSTSLPLTTPWLLISLILYGLLAILGFLGYGPTLRKEIALVESKGPDSVEYQAVARRGMLLGMLVGVITLVIIYLMVAKPT